MTLVVGASSAVSVRAVNNAADFLAVAAPGAQMKVLGLNRMFLHAHSVSFEWPAPDRSETGSARAPSGEFSVNTPLPPELASVIDTLASQKTRSRKR